MRVVAALGGKGGSGKSTIVLNLACEAVRAGKSTAVIDLDPQATSAKWSDRREEKGLHAPNAPVVVSAQAERLDRLLRQAEPDTDIVFIDTQGRETGDAVTVGMKADVILLPSRTTFADIETLPAVINLLRTANAVEKAYVVWNSSLSTDTRIKGGIIMAEDMGLKVCPIVLGTRVAYGDALVSGESVSEIDPDSKASKEVAALYAWVMEKI